MPGGEPVLRVESVEKRYGGVRALRGADLEVGAGEVHGLIGQNGSGKSTLLGVVSGQRWPDAGRVLLDGSEVSFADPAQALAAGIATVTQETTLVPDLSVAENIFLGHRMARSGLGIDWRATRERAREALDRLELAIDPGRPVREMRPDEQQMVEIARAISMEARILILDEPTSSLTRDEVEALFAIVRRLKERGVGVILVTHRLGEIFDVADRVTVLRDGVTVGSGPIDAYDRRRMIREMVGLDVDDYSRASAAAAVRDPVLSVRRLSVPGRVRDVELDVGAGEIVGLAGLVGAGRSEVFRSLFGLEADASGDVAVGGRRGIPASPREAMARGLAYVPGDRKQLGLVLDMSVRENLMMAATARRGRLARPTRAVELPAVRSACERFRVVAPSPSAPVATLSGGNQQKVVLGKWLQTEPRVLMLDEPTRGVDVGAKAEIYRLMEEAKQRGAGILVSSSETPELRAVCDRVLVMFRGELVASLGRDEATEARIAHHATGHRA